MQIILWHVGLQEFIRKCIRVVDLPCAIFQILCDSDGRFRQAFLQLSSLRRGNYFLACWLLSLVEFNISRNSLLLAVI